MRSTKAVSMGSLVFLMLGAVTVSTITGCGLFSKGHFITDLYGYFPQETSFYAEFKPSEADAKKMLSALDKFTGNYDALANKLPARQAELSKHSKQAKQVVRQVSQAFSKDFQSQLALGYWIDEATVGASPRNSSVPKTAVLQDHSLAVLPLKPGTSFETLRKDLNLSLAAPVQINTPEGKIDTYLDAVNKLTYAVSRNNLLIAQDKDTLGSALAQKTKKEQSIASSEVVEKNLGRLSGERNGTIVFQQNKLVKDLQEKQLADVSKKSAQNDFVAQFVKQMDSLSIGSVGGLKIDTANQLVSVDMYTPMDFSKIQNQEMRTQLEAFYTHNGNKNIATVVPDNTILAFSVSGLDHLFGLYENIIESMPSSAGRLSMIKSQLKAAGLDWQQNVVGMFQGTTGLVLTRQSGKQPLPNVTLLLNNSADTQKTFDVLVKRISPLAGVPTEATFKDKKINVLSSPLLPSGISFGDVGSGLYALGISSSVQALPALTGGEPLGKNKNYSVLSDGVTPNPVFSVFADWKGMLQQFPQMTNMERLPLESILVVGSWDGGVSHGQFRIKLASAQ